MLMGRVEMGPIPCRSSSGREWKRAFLPGLTSNSCRVEKWLFIGLIQVKDKNGREMRGVAGVCG